MKKLAISVLLAVVVATVMNQPALALEQEEADKAIKEACGPAASGAGGRAALAKVTKKCVELCAQEMDNSSNAVRCNCKNIRLTARTKDVRTQRCKENECVYRLSCKEAHRGGSVCVGSGFNVSSRPTQSGHRVTITDPSGRTSIFEQCGTCCGEMDHESGPIERASLGTTARGEFLTIYK